MKIRSKVFTVFIIFNAFWLLLAMGLMQYLAKKDFENYLHHKHSYYLETFANYLTAQDNWQRVLDNPQLLQAYQQSFAAQEAHTKHRPPKLVILNRHSDAGPIKKTASVGLKTNTKVVAYLAIKPRKSFYSKAEKHFIKQLKRNFIGLAVGLMIAAAIASLIISRQLLKPIFEISKACEALKNKQWDYRIHSKGQDELAVLARNLDSLASILQATEIQQQTWLASTSHELKTPLAILQGEIEAMARWCTKL